jgi:hypothetical protein
MITRFSLFLALTVLFAMPCKAQQDTGKNSSNKKITLSVNVDTAHRFQADNYRRDWVFSVSTDLAQDAFYQPNLGVDYKINKYLTAGINAGYLFACPLFAVNPLADGQFTYPGTVYSGPTLRINIKLYFGFDNENFRNYVGLQGVYKSISFNNVQFTDDYGDEDYNEYNMSERTSTFGGDLIFGHNFEKRGSRVGFEFFMGIGLHERFRNYTISNELFNGYPPAYGNTPPSVIQGQGVASNGNYNIDETVYPVIIGLKLSFKYFKKTN